MASIGPWLGGGRRGSGGGEMDPWFRFSAPFSSDIWDPYSYRSGSSRSGGVSSHANVDWRETDKAHVFRADLPGVRKEEVKVQVEEGNILQINAERIKEEEHESDKWHYLERQRGGFVRRFRLPENAKMDKVKCALQNGVLTVEVPKKGPENSSDNVRNINIDVA